ncbi:MAG: hypothetical protein HC788_04360 [Sphingopyxis sp.]|nr:hypothetical protein [Sphingopyxis sp.]
MLVALLSSFAAVTVMRLWLSPGGTSVGEALAFAASLIPVIVLLFIIQAISMGFAALLFILPALYLTGRWAPMLALLAAGETRGPIDALAKSWAMTRGNGWRIALMLFLVQLVVAIVTLILDSTGSLFGARGTIGHAVASVINAAMAALGALVAYALSAAVYRQLSSSNVARTFD